MVSKVQEATGGAVTKMHWTMVQVAQPDNIVIPFQELIFRDIRVWEGQRVQLA